MELKPPKKSHSYLLVAIASAFIVGWVFLHLFRPQIIEAGCAEIASASSNIFSASKTNYSPFEFENIKTKCLLDVYLQ